MTRGGGSNCCISLVVGYKYYYMIVIVLALIPSLLGLKYINIQNITVSNVCYPPSFRTNDEAALSCSNFQLQIYGFNGSAWSRTQLLTQLSQVTKTAGSTNYLFEMFLSSTSLQVYKHNGTKYFSRGNYTQFTAPIFHLDVSGDGRFLAASTNNPQTHIFMHDGNAYSQRAVVSECSASGSSSYEWAALSEDGSYLAVACHNGDVKILNWVTSAYTLIQTINHAGNPVSVDLSMNAGLLVFASDAGTLYSFRWDNGQFVHLQETALASNDYVQIFSHSNQYYIASVQTNGYRIMKYNSTAHQLTIVEDVTTISGTVNGLKFSEDGNNFILTTSGPNSAQFFRNIDSSTTTAASTSTSTQQNLNVNSEISSINNELSQTSSSVQNLKTIAIVLIAIVGVILLGVLTVFLCLICRDEKEESADRMPEEREEAKEMRETKGMKEVEEKKEVEEVKEVSYPKRKKRKRRRPEKEKGDYFVAEDPID